MNQYVKPLLLCLGSFIAYPVFLAIAPAGLAIGLTLVASIIVFCVYGPVTRQQIRLPWRTYGQRRGYGYHKSNNNNNKSKIYPGKRSSSSSDEPGPWFIKKQ